VDKLLVLLAGLVFAVSIVCIVQANQRAEAHHRARQRHERDKVAEAHHRARQRHERDKLHGWQRPHRSAEGMIVALLANSGPGHIVVGGRTLWLRDGETCAYTVGTPIRVLYTVVDGRRLVDGIMAMPPLG
jgi:hypothetical protein